MSMYYLRQTCLQVAYFDPFVYILFVPPAAAVVNQRCKKVMFHVKISQRSTTQCLKSVFASGTQHLISVRPVAPYKQSPRYQYITGAASRTGVE